MHGLAIPYGMLHRPMRFNGLVVPFGTLPRPNKTDRDLAALWCASSITGDCGSPWIIEDHRGSPWITDHRRLSRIIEDHHGS